MFGLPINQNLCHYSVRFDAQHFREFAPSNRPTDSLHTSCICSFWKILHFYSSLSLNPSKSTFFHVLTFLFRHVVYCLLTVRTLKTVHIEYHMNRFEILSSRTIITIAIVLGLFCQKIVSFAAQLGVNLHVMKVSTEINNIFGYEKATQLVDNIPL